MNENSKDHVIVGETSDVRGGAGRETPLPCPHCGQTPTGAEQWGGYYAVVCTAFACQAEGPPRDTSAGAIAAWNRRAPSAPADKAEAVPVAQILDAEEALRGLMWLGDTPAFDGMDLYAAPPPELLREVMEALDLLTELHDAMGAPQGAARIKAGAAIEKLREQLGEQG